MQPDAAPLCRRSVLGPNPLERPSRTILVGLIVGILLGAFLIVATPSPPTSAGRISGVAGPSGTMAVAPSRPPAADSPLTHPTGSSLPPGCVASSDQVDCGAHVPASPAPFSASPGWTNLTAPPQPPALLSTSVTYDAADGYVLLFGGLAGAHAVNQTWKFQDGAWTNLTGSVGTAPSPRFDMAMTYDPADGYVLAFGGVADPSICGGTYAGWPGCPLNGTWAFHAGSWSHLNVTCADWTGVVTIPYTCAYLVGGPVSMTYDAHDGYVVSTQWGGYSGFILASTLSYAQGVWTYLGGAHQPYGFTGVAALTYDASDGYVLGFGRDSSDYRNFTQGPANGGNATGNTYEFSNRNWTNLTATLTGDPSPRYDPGLAYDTQDGYVVLDGGWNLSCYAWSQINGCYGRTLHEMSDTWSYHNGTWTNLTVTPSPGARGAPRLVDDPADRTVLAVGGWSCSPLPCHDPGGGWYALYGRPGGPLNGTPSPGTWAWGSTPPLSGLSVAASPSPVTAGSLVNLSVGYIGGTAPVSVVWTFDSGGNASGANVTFVFLTPGAHHATVWVNDSAGFSRSAILTVTVNPPLALGARATPAVSEVGLPLQFSAGRVNGTAPFSYNWSFGDGNSSAAIAPVHAYSVAGNYSATLAVTDSGGAIAYAQLSIGIHPALVVVMNASRQPIDLGQLENFTANVSGGVGPYAYSWAFGDGGTGGNLANISHIYTTNGPFWPGVTVTDSVGGTSTATLPLQVALNVSILSNGTLGAAPLGLRFASHVVGGEPGYRYAWSFGDGATASLPDPVHTYLAQGVYSANVQITDAAGATATSEVWTVTVEPGGGPLSLRLTGNHPTLPLGGTETLLAAPSGGAGTYALSWTQVPSGCAVVSVLSVVCSPGQSGTYLVRAVVADAAGENTSASVSFTVGGSSSPGGLLPGSVSPTLSAILWVALVAGVAAGTVAGAAFVGLSRVGASRRGASSTGPYARYQRGEPPEDHGAPAASYPEPPDRLDDLL